jgi:DNA-binding Xre family transcriptional regulator
VLNESEVLYMRMSRKKVNIALARKQMTVTELAEAYGVSRARMNVILNSQVVTPVCAGRVAKALDVDVTEIIDQEGE